jgi:hypothetical protein
MKSLPSASFALIDAARAGSNLARIQNLAKTSRCLFIGKSAGQLGAVAPYLIEFGAEPSELEQLLHSAWGDAWGVLVNSECTFEMLWRHFRKFLLVEKSDGTKLYFRFYDPRVLRVILPSFERRQLTEFFGPVKEYILEDTEPGSGLRFKLDFSGSRLATAKL